MRGKKASLSNGSMHGAEIGTFTCSAGKERILHQVTSYAAIIASGSLMTVEGDARDARAMQTVNFTDPAELGGMKLRNRCRDCTLAAWQACTLPKRRVDRVRLVRRSKRERVVFK